MSEAGVEGHFTPSKKRTRFFRTKGFLRIFDGFFLQTKGFLPKAYEIFWSEMPLGGRGPESHGGTEISALVFNLCYKKLHSPYRPTGNGRVRRFSP